MRENANSEKQPWYRHDYFAPVSEPLRYIAMGTLIPIAPFLDGIDKALNRHGSNWDVPLPVRISREWRDGPARTYFTATAGCFLGAIAGIALGGNALIGTSLALPWAIAGTIAAGAAGLMAAPLAVICALAIAGAAAGTIASPVGMATGLFRAVRHGCRQIAERKAKPAPGEKTADKAMQAVMALPNLERLAAARALQEKLNAAFGEAAKPQEPKSAASSTPMPGTPGFREWMRREM